jgi:hypothetical protein
MVNTNPMAKKFMGKALYQRFNQIYELHLNDGDCVTALVDDFQHEILKRVKCLKKFRQDMMGV